MRRLAVAPVLVALLALATAAHAGDLLTPDSVDPSSDGLNSESFSLHPPMPNIDIDKATVVVPVGFKVWACQSFAFTCSGITQDEAQPTTVQWTRDPQASDAAVSDYEFFFGAIVKAVPGDYTFGITIVDRSAVSHEYQDIVHVNGAAPAASTTTTGRPARTATTSTSTSTSTSEPSTTTSTTEATTTTTAPADRQSEDGGSNGAAPLAAGVVVVGAAGTAAAVLLRRSRSAI